MALIQPHDRVAETSTSNSQTVFALAGALDTSYNRFSASMSVGDLVVGGVVEAGVAFKTGVLKYSNTNEITVFFAAESKGTFSTSGTKEVFMGLPGSKTLLVVPNHLTGLTLSTAGASSTFSVAAGVAADSTNVDMMTLAASISKTTSSWAVGTGNGGLDTGAIANNTFYYAYLIKRIDTGVVDVLISLSATSPTLPTNYTISRRIGAIRTDGSAKWLAFTQIGDKFFWTTPTLDFNSTVSTSRTVVQLTAPASMEALVRVYFFSTTVGVGLVVQPTAETDAAVSFTASPLTSLYSEATSQGAAGDFSVFLDASIQFALRASASSTARVVTKGWIDRRGKD